MSDDTCPGVGRCHGPWSWCPDCDVTSAGPCDMRARGERCDAHPSSAVLRPQLEDARHEVACLDEDTAPLLREAMRAEKAATTARAAANWGERQLAQARTRATELQDRLTAALRDEVPHA